MALRSPVYKPSALPRRGASPLVGEQLVGRRWLAERCTLADADLHTYWWRERHQMRRTVRIWLVRVGVGLCEDSGWGRGAELCCIWTRPRNRNILLKFMIKRSFFTGLDISCVFTYIYLHIKYRTLLFENRSRCYGFEYMGS